MQFSLIREAPCWSWLSRKLSVTCRKWVLSTTNTPASCAVLTSAIAALSRWMTGHPLNCFFNLDLGSTSVPALPLATCEAAQHQKHGGGICFTLLAVASNRGVLGSGFGHRTNFATGQRNEKVCYSWSLYWNVQSFMLVNVTQKFWIWLYLAIPGDNRTWAFVHTVPDIECGLPQGQDRYDGHECPSMQKIPLLSDA